MIVLLKYGILVPANYTFFDFHVAIQNAMGWCDGHLHAFHIAQKGTAKPLEIRFSDPENDDQFGGEFLDERLERIADELYKICQHAPAWVDAKHKKELMVFCKQSIGKSIANLMKKREEKFDRTPAKEVERLSALVSGPGNTLLYGHAGHLRP